MPDAVAASEATLATAPLPDPAAAATAALFPSADGTTTAEKADAANAAATPEAKAAAEAATKAALEKAAAETPEAKAAAEAAAKLAADALKNETPEAKAAREKVEQEAKDKAAKEAKAKVVPEKYEFTAPQGIVNDPAVVAEFSAVAKELQLSQADAQRVYDIGVKMQQTNFTNTHAEIVKTQASWLAASEADPEYGGSSIKANMSVAQRALSLSPGIRQLLDETKLGNHPEVIRWMYRVGKLMLPDSHVNGRQPPVLQDAAHKLYPNQK